MVAAGGFLSHPQPTIKWRNPAECREISKGNFTRVYEAGKPQLKTGGGEWI